MNVRWDFKSCQAFWQQKFRDTSLSRSREIPPEVVIFDSFFRINFRLEVISDVKAIEAVE